MFSDEYQTQRTGFQINTASDEIGYDFRPSHSDFRYWSLPAAFTGNKIKSYGGKLRFKQRYTQRPQSRYIPDRDIIISGNRIKLFWNNPNEQHPDVSNVI